MGSLRRIQPNGLVFRRTLGRPRFICDMLASPDEHIVGTRLVKCPTRSDQTKADRKIPPRRTFREPSHSSILGPYLRPGANILRPRPPSLIIESHLADESRQKARASIVPLVSCQVVPISSSCMVSWSSAPRVRSTCLKFCDMNRAARNINIQYQRPFPQRFKNAILCSNPHHHFFSHFIALSPLRTG